MGNSVFSLLRATFCKVFAAIWGKRPLFLVEFGGGTSNAFDFCLIFTQHIVASLQSICLQQLGF